MNQVVPLSKKARRRLRKQEIVDENNNVKLGGNFNLAKIEPKTISQEDAFESFDDGLNLMLHGTAGTGKTFIALYFALREVLQNQSYKKIAIFRSAVAGREIGHLPGSKEEKEKVFELPYYEICQKLFNRGDAYQILKTKNIIEFATTSHIRGITIDDAIIIVDECQNMSDQELHTIMTRLGENSRIIFCGDVRQDDLTSTRKKELSGLNQFMKIIETMREFDFIEFNCDDIVRSGIVKSYIIARENLGL